MESKSPFLRDVQQTLSLVRIESTACTLKAIAPSPTHADRSSNFEAPHARNGPVRTRAFAVA
eukprot:1698058-Pleurochrysis_carterae.AAC.1